MKIETILNAMTYAVMERNLLPTHTPLWDKKQRQARAFRARILRMDREKDWKIDRLEGIIARKIADIKMMVEAKDD